MKTKLAIVLILSGAITADLLGRERQEPANDTEINQYFNMHSGFWLNLHHFLYLQAVLATPEARKDGATAVSRAVPVRQMNSEQRVNWDKALAYYRQFGGSDPLRDRDLITANYELSDAGNTSSIEGRHLNPEMKAALKEAAPVYRAVWWNDQDQKNRKWIERAALLVRKYGKNLSSRIASVYGTTWPTDKIPVEVVFYANWAGAYTTTHDTLITVSSVDPANQGNAALEILFHEASHALIDPVQEALANQCRLQAVTLNPPTLWHAILFYTTGILVREQLPGYTPLANSIGLWQRAWPMYIGPLKTDWQPYLDGKTSFSSALANLVKDVGHGQPAPQLK
jgi:hypothetical protein